MVTTDWKTMNTKENQISLFDTESGTAMYKHRLTLEKIKNDLISFGLTKSQAKVFVYLGKYGTKSASEMAKALQLPRTETYHLVNSLQRIGLVVAKLSYPTKYDVIEMKEAVSILVRQEQNRIDVLANQTESISKMWDSMPFFAVETDESQSEKMQLLHGSVPIINKIKEMISTSTDEFRIYGSIPDLFRMHHSDVFDWIQNVSINLEVIACQSSLNHISSLEFLSEINSSMIRVITSDSKNKCFVVNDKKEVLIFMRGATHPTGQVFAWWSDSETLTDMMNLLFELSWEKGDVL